MKRRAKVVNLYECTKRVQYIEMSQEEYEELLFNGSLDKELHKHKVTTKAVDLSKIEDNNKIEAHNYGIN